MTEVREVSVVAMRGIRLDPDFEPWFWYTTPEDRYPGEEGRIGDVRYRLPATDWERLKRNTAYIMGGVWGRN